MSSDRGTDQVTQNTDTSSNTGDPHKHSPTSRPQVSCKAHVTRCCKFHKYSQINAAALQPAALQTGLQVVLTLNCSSSQDHVKNVAKY